MVRYSAAMWEILLSLHTTSKPLITQAITLYSWAAMLLNFSCISALFRIDRQLLGVTLPGLSWRERPELLRAGCVCSDAMVPNTGFMGA